MSDTALDIDFSTLESYEFTVPCEYSGHLHKHVPEDPGAYFIQVDVSCMCSPRYIMCESGLQHLNSQPHLNCEHHGNSQEFRVTILEKLK